MTNVDDHESCRSASRVSGASGLDLCFDRVLAHCLPPHEALKLFSAELFLCSHQLFHDDS